MGKSEFELIAWIQQQALRAARPEADIAVGIGDDMAVLGAGPAQVLITTDTLLDGVHFDLAAADPAAVGYKVMACSLSDCAAMAAEPWAAVVAATLPQTMPPTKAQALLEGMNQAAARYHCPLVGGDTTSWPQPLALTVTMLARPAGIEPVLRRGACAGDAIMVTGVLGGSLAGRHLTFKPRVCEARWAAGRFALHAMIDLSDGLAGDLRHICEASAVGAVIDAAAVPISAAAQGAPDPLRAALTDGEDFELLFCVAEDVRQPLLAAWRETFETPLTCVGRIVPPEQAGPTAILLRRADKITEPMTWRGWEHFRDDRNA